jgi:hypothetical protein
MRIERKAEGSKKLTRNWQEDNALNNTNCAPLQALSDQSCFHGCESTPRKRGGEKKCPKRRREQLKPPKRSAAPPRDALRHQRRTANGQKNTVSQERGKEKKATMKKDEHTASLVTLQRARNKTAFVRSPLP